MESNNLICRNSASVEEKVIEELVRGREFAAQLQLVHHELTGSGQDESPTAEVLVTKILMSFTEALSLLNYSEFPASLRCRDQRRKRSKRRKMQETWTRITSTPIDDGYAWRKYGQKEILNAKHLRCYYRCTDRFDQGCQATKQVQRTDEDGPPRFWTKYIGHHTCQDLLNASLMGMDSTAEEGLLINFESNTTTKQEPPFSSSSFPSSNKEELHKKSFPSIKQEYYLPVPHFVSGANSCSSSSSSNFNMDMEELIDSAYLNDLLKDEELV